MNPILPEDDPDLPIQSRPFAPENKHRSRAIRFKLITLVAMLLLVVYSMIEAGKPERWEWMGFMDPANNAPEKETRQSGATTYPPTSTNPPSVKIAPADQPSPLPESASSIRTPPPVVFENLSAPVSRSPNAADYPVAAARFWSQMLKELDDQQQSDLFRLIKAMRNSVPIQPSSHPHFQILVQSLTAPRDRFHQTLFDELALTSDRSPQKTERSNELYESQEIWEKRILPAMTAAAQGQDFTISQQQAVEQLQSVLDVLALNQIDDHQAIGWTGDAEAWKRLWEKTIHGPAPDSNPVTRIQLMGQPNLFRGKTVTVSGWVRSARKKILAPNSELGIPHYFILWVRPKETKLGPFCIYARTLPEGFPAVSETFSDMNENIQVSGYFFKIRTYVAADHSVQNCPVIIAQSISPLATPVPFIDRRWEPSRMTLIVILAFIPLLAIAIARFVFRSSATSKIKLSEKRERQIDQSLVKLADDPRVQTDQEKIMSLYEKEFDHE